MIKAIIFDMDGLMFDTESAYNVVQSEMSEKRGKVFTMEVKMPLMGRRAHEVMSMLNDFWGNNEDIEELLAEQDKKLIEIYNSIVQKLNGLDSLIALLNKHKIRKCVGSSSRRFLIDVLLKKFDLEKEFEFIISGDMVVQGKPNPEIYHKCLDRLNLPGEGCLVLEDSFNGIKAAVAAGCKSCAIPSEYTKNEDFSIADLIVDSLDDKRLTDYLLGKRL